MVLLSLQHLAHFTRFRPSQRDKRVLQLGMLQTRFGAVDEFVNLILDTPCNLQHNRSLQGILEQYSGE